MDCKRIVLIGFRGTGKSTIGALLARSLNWKLISTDTLIEKHHQMEIKDIVAKYGWKEFRRMEHSVIKTISARMNSVVDCGGGVTENPENLNLLRPGSLIVWVDADIEEIRKRLKKDGELRPLLSEAEFDIDLHKNYQRRRPVYQSYARMQVNSSTMSPAEICERILNELNQPGQ